MKLRTGIREYRDPRPGEVERWLSGHVSEMKREGPGELRFQPSPCCNRHKPGGAGAASTCVNAETGLWQCHRCGAKGNWFTLTRAFGDPLPLDDRYRDPPPEVSLAAYDEKRALTRRPVTGGHYPKLLDYCHFRGFSDGTLDAWRVSTCGERTLRWPVYAWTGGTWQIVNARLRVVIGREEVGTKDWFEVRGGPTNLMIGNHLLNVRNPHPLAEKVNRPCGVIKQRVIVTEGQWDAMAAWELGFERVLSLPNGAGHVHVASMLRYVPDDWEVWLALDMDEAGERATEQFYAQVGYERCARIVMPYKDLNEWLMAVPALTADDVLARVQGVAPLAAEERAERPLGATTGRFIKVGSRREADRKTNIICELPWPGVTRRLAGGLRQAQTTGILAPSGIGKTTLVNQLAVHAASLGIRVGMISLEGSREAVDEAISAALAGLTGEEPGSDAFGRVADNLMLSPLEGSRVPWAECVEHLRDMVTAGAQLLVLDNLDYIMPRNDPRTHNVKSEAYAALIDLATETRTHVVVVWQPNKVERDKPINSGNQKGMSQLFQDADNYVSMNAAGKLRRIEVEKCRHDGRGAIPGENVVLLKYNHDTRALYETDEQPDEARDEFSDY